MGHFLDLDTRALGLFRIRSALAALGTLPRPTSRLPPPPAFQTPRSQPRPRRRSLRLPARRPTSASRHFAPVLTSAATSRSHRAPAQVHPAILSDLICIHGEYEAGSTLAFYLQRPSTYATTPGATNFIHILEGRSSNLWYGSFFPDAPKIFETPQTLAAKWQGPQRIFLWQSLTDSAPTNSCRFPAPFTFS